MKKSMISVLIAVLIFTLLAGCAAEPVPTAPQSNGGTLYITVNPVIAVTYDEKGNVTEVAAVTEDAKSIVESYQNFVEKECTQVVSELVTKIGEAGYLSEDSEEVTITITLEEGSGVPSEDFVTAVEQTVQKVVTDNHWQGSVTVEEPSVSVEDPTEPSGNPTKPATTPTTPEEDPTEPATEPTVAEPAVPGTVPEGAKEQSDGTYLLTEELDSSGNPATGTKAVSVRSTVYSADGMLLRQETIGKESGNTESLLTWEYGEDGALEYTTSTQYTNGTKRFYEELYPNGNPKSHKMWNESGALVREFEAFHGENNNNGVSIQYDDQGNIQFRDTFGNPDGSPDTSEMWDADGTYHVNKFADGMPVETGYISPDGRSVTEMYDYEAGTIHVISKQGTNYADTVISMETGKIISGVIESTLEDGTYHYTEYLNGYRYKEISDGYANPLGFVYKETITYHPNGQPKTSERYFYEDGGHTYIEFDENGNTTFSEITTECNYGVFG